MKGVSRSILAGMFGVVAVLLVVGGHWLYNREARLVQEAEYHQLRAIADLKADQIITWRLEKFGDARLHSTEPFFRSAVQRWLENPGDESLAADIRIRLQQVLDFEGYANAVLTGLDGRVLLSLDPRLTELESVARDLVARVISSGEAAFGDFVRCPTCGEVHLDVAAPILDAADRPAAVLLLRLDPEDYLYPLIQLWPTASRSAETLLVRKDGDHILFLNKLRHRPDPALTVRLPLSRTDVPAVQAVLGRTGTFEGRDYRGVEVLADVRPVPGTGWFMVAKTDLDEILAELRYRGGVILLFVVLSILMTAALLALAYNRRQRLLYQDLLRAEQEHRKVQEEIRATLYAIGDGVIATDTSGRVTRMNPVAEQLTGWTEAEALGKPLAEVFRIVNEETRAGVENPVERVLREGVVVGLANHSLLVAREGTERPIADSGAPIRNAEGTVAGVVLVFRDQTEERAALARLLEEKRKAQQYLDVAGVMMIGLDTEANVVLVNRKACEILQREEAEILGKNWFDLAIPERERSSVREVFSRIIAGDVNLDACHENAVLTRSGEERLIAWQNVLLRDEKGAIVGTLSSGNDITERRRIEKALDESWLLYRHLFEQAPVGIAVHTEGKIVFANPAAARLLGVRSPEEMTGKPIREIVHPDQWDAAQDRIRRLFAGETGIYPVETVYRRVDGTPLPVEVTSALVTFGGKPAIQVIVTDITARKQAENELRRKEQVLSQSQAIAHIGSWEVERELEQIRWSNEMYRIFGVTPESFCPTTDSFLQAIHPEDREAMKNWIRDLWAGKQPESLEFRIIRPNGECRFIHGRGSVQCDDQGRPVRAVGTAQDITERKQAERRREELEEQLRQAQKMESVGRLAGGVAHDFNNVLTVILGHTSLGLGIVEEDDPLHASLLEIREAGERAATLTRQLLAFSRKQVLKPEPLDLSRVVARLEKMLRRLIGEDIELVRYSVPDLGVVMADPGQIEQVILNLAVNARDAMPEGGKLTIETANVELDEEYAAQHVGVTPGPYVMLAVTDTGCGMDEQTRSRIFEPFFTTKGVGEGTGLGLSTVYGIIRQSGGHIWVYSEPGQGTTFKIYLPHDLEARAPGPWPSEPVVPATGTETILIVEDEDAVRKLTERILTEAGYTVLTAANPGEALRTCERHDGEIHLLLTDVVMPQMSGRALADRLVTMRPGLKVLYMSGYTDNAIVHHGVLEAGTQFIGKPFTMAELTRRVREVLDSPI